MNEVKYVQFLHGLKPMAIQIAFVTVIAYILFDLITKKFKRIYLRILPYSIFYLGGCLLVFLSLLGCIYVMIYRNFNGQWFYLGIMTGLFCTIIGNVLLYKKLGYKEKFQEKKKGLHSLFGYLLFMLAYLVLRFLCGK